MKTYSVRTEWQVRGSGYPLNDTHIIKAGSVKAAAAHALNGAFRKTRRGWREMPNAVFTCTVTVLGPEINLSKEEG